MIKTDSKSGPKPSGNTPLSLALREDTESEIKNWPHTLQSAMTSVLDLPLFKFDDDEFSEATIKITKHESNFAAEHPHALVGTYKVNYTLPRYPQVLHIPENANYISICGHVVDEKTLDRVNLETIALLIAVLDRAKLKLQWDEDIPLEDLNKITPRKAVKIILSRYSRGYPNISSTPRVPYMSPILQLLRSNLTPDPSFTSGLIEKWKQHLKSYDIKLYGHEWLETKQEHELLGKQEESNLNSITYEADDSTALPNNLDKNIKDILNKLTAIEQKLDAGTVQNETESAPTKNISENNTDLSDKVSLGRGGARRTFKRDGSASDFKRVQLLLSKDLVPQLKSAVDVLGGNQSALAEQAIREFLSREGIKLK